MASKKISLTLKEEVVDAVNEYSKNTGIPKSRIYSMAAMEYLNRKLQNEKSEIIWKGSTK